MDDCRILLNYELGVGFHGAEIMSTGHFAPPFSFETTKLRHSLINKTIQQSIENENGCGVYSLPKHQTQGSKEAK